MMQVRSPADDEVAHPVSVQTLFYLLCDELARLAQMSADAEAATDALASDAVVANDVRLQRLDALTQNLNGLQTYLRAIASSSVGHDKTDAAFLVADVVPRDLAARLLPKSDFGAPDDDGEIDLF